MEATCYDGSDPFVLSRRVRMIAATTLCLIDDASSKHLILCMRFVARLLNNFNAHTRFYSRAQEID